MHFAALQGCGFSNLPFISLSWRRLLLLVQPDNQLRMTAKTQSVGSPFCAIEKDLKLFLQKIVLNLIAGQACKGEASIKCAKFAAPLPSHHRRALAHKSGLASIWSVVPSQITSNDSETIEGNIPT